MDLDKFNLDLTHRACPALQLVQTAFKLSVEDLQHLTKSKVGPAALTFIVGPAMLLAKSTALWTLWISTYLDQNHQTLVPKQILIGSDFLKITVMRKGYISRSNPDQTLSADTP